MFYSALYHAVLSPRVFSDVSGRYIGMDNRVRSVAAGHAEYADYSGWDTYRAQMQLVSLLDPVRAADMAQSLINDGHQSGCLPKWPVANGQTHVQVGDPADLLLVDADAFGASGFDRAAGLRAMLKGANRVCQSATNGAYVERQALLQYVRLGYVPAEDDTALGGATTVADPAGAWGSAATTLEYSAADFAIAQFARRLGRRATAATLLRRSANWRRLFNPRTGYVQQRSGAGAFNPRYDPASGNGFVEGSGAQYTWAVPHDLAGLFKSMGGRKTAIGRLDAFFTELNAGPNSTHAFLGNEPTLETPWEYDWLGQPCKTQRVVRRALTEL